MWFYRHLPSGRRQLQHFRSVADEFNAFATRKIAEVRREMEAGDEQSNFIANYLREVEKSGGKLDDR